MTLKHESPLVGCQSSLFSSCSWLWIPRPSQNAQLLSPCGRAPRFVWLAWARVDGFYGCLLLAHHYMPVVEPYVRVAFGAWHRFGDACDQHQRRLVRAVWRNSCFSCDRCSCTGRPYIYIKSLYMIHIVKKNHGISRNAFSEAKSTSMTGVARCRDSTA